MKLYFEISSIVPVIEPLIEPPTFPRYSNSPYFALCRKMTGEYFLFRDNKYIIEI